jgi:mono/diheme cytochrome c family protein
MKRSICAIAALSGLWLSGCTNSQRLTQVEVWDDMKRQPKVLPQSASFRPVAGTVARGHLNLDDVYHTGMIDAETYTGRNPERIDAGLLKLGQARFNTYCSPCHDRTGSGKGIVAIKTPAWQPTNLMDARIRTMADGEIFHIVTNGRRTMPAYKYQVVEHDRWAVVAYLRALQRATNATVADVPSGLRAELR